MKSGGKISNMWLIIGGLLVILIFVILAAKSGWFA